jgi:hypothetical protein
MAVSKHVEEVLELLRSHVVAGCTSNGTEIGIIGIDTYPEETTNIILLANGKRITTDDLEFADTIIGNSQTKIVLGNYIFHLDVRGVKPECE